MVKNEADGLRRFIGNIKEIFMLYKERKISAVCFDYRGTILDHKSDRDLVPGMENILSALKKENIPMALVSRFPKDVLEKRLGSLKKYFGENIYSGGGKGKLECIIKFAKKIGIKDFSQIVFIDDKPDNLVPVSRESDIFVIGFAGSGKYPGVGVICRERRIAYAESVEILKRMLLEQICKT